MQTISARLRTGLAGDSLLRSVFTLVAGTAIGHIVIAAASPILTRLYAPADFGLLAVYVSLLAILSSVATFRLALAIPLAKEEGQAIGLAKLSMGVAAIIALLVAVAIAAIQVFWPLQSINVQLGGNLWLLPLGVVIGGVLETMSFICVRERQYDRLSESRVTQSIGLTIVQIVGGLLGFGAVGLIFGDMLSRIAAVGSLARKRLGSIGLNLQDSQSDPIARKSILRQGSMSQAWKSYRWFGFLGSLGTFLNALSYHLPAICLAYQYGPAVAGWFALAMRVVWGPLHAVRASMGDVYTAEAARLKRCSPELMPAFYRATLRRLLLIEGLPTILLCLACPFVFPIIFGESWRETGIYAAIGLPMYLLGFVVYPATQTLLVLERLSAQLFWECLRVTFSLGGLLLPAVLGFSARWSVAGCSLGMFISYAVLVWVVDRTLKRWSNDESEK